MEKWCGVLLPAAFACFLAAFVASYFDDIKGLGEDGGQLAIRLKEEFGYNLKPIIMTG